MSVGRTGCDVICEEFLYWWWNKVVLCVLKTGDSRKLKSLETECGTVQRYRYRYRYGTCHVKYR